MAMPKSLLMHTSQSFEELLLINIVRIQLLIQSLVTITISVKKIVLSLMLK